MSPTFKSEHLDKEMNSVIKQMKSELLIQISNLTFELQKEMPENLKKLMDKIYFDIVCQGVFYSLFYAFPKSRTKFNKDFKCDIFKIISKIFKGCEVSHKSRFLKNWRFIDDWYLNLGAGNLLSENQSILKSGR